MHDEIETLLEANAEFYRSFRDRDYAGMGRVWAHDADVVCVHPGWQPLTGRAAVLASWFALLAQGGDLRIHCSEAQGRLWGAIGVVTCRELLGDAHLIATNVFRHGVEGWRLIHHQAGATPPPELPAFAPPDRVLH